MSAKATGYAFSLNLVRSLGLWSGSAVFPSDIQKPQYLPLLGVGNSVDWSELLRKYSKHNASNPSTPLVVATAKLEVTIWKAIHARQEAKLGMRKSRSNAGGRGRRDAKAGRRHQSDDEWLVKNASAQTRIRMELQELQSHLQSHPNAPSSSANAVIALAHYALSEYSQCLERVDAASGKMSAQNNPTSESHDLDLEILALVLKGLALEHLSRSNPQFLQNALATYRSMPVSPPPPMPEAQRYTEVGLSRLMHIVDSGASDDLKASTGSAGSSHDRHATPLDAYRNYFAVTSKFSRGANPRKRVLSYQTYLERTLQQIEETRQMDPTGEGGETFGANSRTSYPTEREVQSTFEAYERTLLSEPLLSAFPRAGEPTPYIDSYLDLSYSFWALSLLPPSFFVASMTRCLSHTYASQRLLRYLTIVLSYLSWQGTDMADRYRYAIEAKKNLDLYVKLFEKSRETDQMAILKELKTFREKNEGIEALQGEEEDAEDAAGNATDGSYLTEEEGSALPRKEREERAIRESLESDFNFCTVCCTGTRMLLRHAARDGLQEFGDERIDLVKDGLDLITKAAKLLGVSKLKELDKQDDSKGSDALQRVKSEVLLWYAVAQADWAYAEADPERSREKAQEALKFLEKSVALLPAASADSAPSTTGRGEQDPYLSSSSLRYRALYSLAFAQLELRDVRSASRTAKAAVEALPSSNVSTGDQYDSALPGGGDQRVWHLFVLALSAKKSWKKAKEVSDLALFGEKSNVAGAGSSTDVSEVRGDTVAGQTAESQAQPNGVGSAAVPPETPLETIGSEDVMYPRSPKMHIVGETRPAPAAALQETDAREIDGISQPMQSVFTNGTVANGGGRLTTHDSGSSSFVHVTSPTRSRSASMIASTVHRRQHAHHSSATALGTASRLEQTSSPWDELEYEVQFMITRNKCIEAVHGPELALQDLQQNVFTRFTRRREELDEVTRSQQDEGKTYPSPRGEMMSPQHQAAMQRLQTEQGEPVTRTRSLLGSIRQNHHSRNTSGVTASDAPKQRDHLSVPQGQGGSIRSATTAPTGSKGAVAQNGQNGRHPQAAKLLSRLWLTSAASFRRWGKMAECRGAIAEAENVAGDTDPDVWLQYALHLLASGTDDAACTLTLQSLIKAISLSTDHVPSLLTLASVHLDKLSNVALAEGFLDVSTQTNAWDSPEGWYMLAKVYERTRRGKRARDCLTYALGLQETRPVREIRAAVPRYL